MIAARLFPLLLLAAACASSTAAKHAPKMFGPDQLRAAFPQGTSLRFRYEKSGAPATIERWTFVVSTSSIAVVETERFDAQGKPAGETTRGQATWAELSEHGSFPIEQTTIEEAELDTAIGRHHCKLYKVSVVDEGEPAIRTFYFAIDLPGPPIRFETWKKGERVFHAEMIERTGPAR